MKKRFTAFIICILFFTTVSTIGTSKIDANSEEMLEIQRFANTDNKGATYREFIRGRISSLSDYGDIVSFHAKAVRSIRFISDGDSVLLSRNWYWGATITYFGMNFIGIMKPHFIFGVFSGTI